MTDPPHGRRGNLETAKTIAIIVAPSLVLVLATIVGPSLRTARHARASLALLGTPWLILIGLGFMFVGIGIIQRVSLFLGHPVYGLARIRQHDSFHRNW
jgi:hypothetical protein